MTPGNSDAPPPNEPRPRSAGLLRVLGAVLASFFGVRRRASGEHDMVTMKPLHVIIAAVLAAAALVATILVLVSFITREG